MFRRAFNIVYIIIATLIQLVINFFKKLKLIKNAPYKDLLWRHKILKTVLIGIQIAIIVSVFSFVVSSIIMAIVFFAVASAFGPGLTNGINEAAGRNRYRRF